MGTLFEVRRRNPLRILTQPEGLEVQAMPWLEENMTRRGRRPLERMESGNVFEEKPLCPQAGIRLAKRIDHGAHPGFGRGDERDHECCRPEMTSGKVLLKGR